MTDNIITFGSSTTKLSDFAEHSPLGLRRYLCFLFDCCVEIYPKRWRPNAPDDVRARPTLAEFKEAFSDYVTQQGGELMVGFGDLSDEDKKRSLDLVDELIINIANDRTVAVINSIDDHYRLVKKEDRTGYVVVPREPR
jgi:hypothetical protein